MRRRSRGLISWLSSQVGRLTQPDIRNMTEYDKTQGNMPWPVKREVQKRIVHSGGQYWPVKAWLLKRYSFRPLPPIQRSFGLHLFLEKSHSTISVRRILSCPVASLCLGLSLMLAVTGFGDVRCPGCPGREEPGPGREFLHNQGLTSTRTTKPQSKTLLFL